MKLRVAAAAVALTLLVGAAAASRGAAARANAGTVHITIHYSSFAPDSLDVDPGETVRFVIRNTDPIDHEFILGDPAVQRRHEQGRERHHHGDVPGERSVAAGQEAATTYSFPFTLDGQTLEFACHLPGHYAYGMHGTARVG